MRNLFILFLFISTISCSQKKVENKGEIFLKGEPLIELTDARLQEPSGLAASANNPGLLWTHNDSGNPAEIFLVDQNLNIKLVCQLKGITNRDWEDIAVGPGPIPGKNYIYVGEIGDNFAVYPAKQIYRFEEPVFKEGESMVLVSSFDTITFNLEDGAKDTETLMIHPKTKNIYIVSKREDPVYLYELRYPYSGKDTLTAVKLFALPFTQSVAGDFSRDGKEVLMKNYKSVLYWNMGNQPVTKALKSPPVYVNYIEEPQGESVTFALDGSGFFTISEQVKDKKSFLYFYPRKSLQKLPHQ